MTSHTGLGGRALIVAIPYLWLAFFFLIPFLIVLKISLSDDVLAQPPYAPILDFATGWAGLRVFVTELDWISPRDGRVFACS
jgi:putrescine transport system permease protein